MVGGLGAMEMGVLQRTRPGVWQRPDRARAGLEVAPCLLPLHTPFISPPEELASSDLGL